MSKNVFDYQTSDSLSGLTPNTSYLFRITASDLVGDESAASASTTAITSPALPAVPTGLTTSLSDGNVVVSWTGGSTLATGYNIYYSTDNGATFNYLDSVDAGQASYTTSGLDAGAAYQFEVTAEDASGETAASSALTQAVPQTPDVAVKNETGTQRMKRGRS